jgi:hypothetical protein
MNKNKLLTAILSTTLCVTLLPIAGCDKKTPDQAQTNSTASSVTPTQSVYVPPTADQLYQMVGPIALFPDKLVAQVLAGSSYPTQITAADNWVLQNKNLAPTQLQTAINQQPWDVSVKGLVMFPDVLDQMAQNLPWTTALGTAYVNDPTDVMNAIQVMRQRASTSGNLKASKQQKITITPRLYRPPDQAYDVQEGAPIVYSGPDVISPPDQTYIIDSADPDMVYVPSYNSRVAYGEPMQNYPGYQENYARPSGYSTGEIVTAGALTFGAGIAIAALSHHDGGWNSWGMHWGGHRHDNGNYDQNGGNPNGGWHRPAVEYNNSTYVSHSTTVINRINENNYYNTRNTTNNNDGNESNRASHNNAAGQPNFVQPANGSPSNAQSTPNQPNFNGMHEPHFNKTEVAAAAGAVAIGGAAMAVSHFNHPNPRPNGNPSAPPTAPNFNNPSQPNFGHHGWNGGSSTQPPNKAGNQPNFGQHANNNPSAPPKAPNFNNPSQPNFGHHGWNGGSNTPRPNTTPNPMELHQQVAPSIKPQSSPTFEHQQWGQQDKPHQLTPQTPDAPKPIAPQQQQLSNPLSENQHHEHQGGQPHQQAPETQAAPPQQSTPAVEHHQWGHAPQQQTAPTPQIHVQPVAPEHQPVAAPPQFHRDPISEPQKWGHPPSPQPAPHIQLHEQHQPPQQVHPQPAAPKTHDNHQHPDKKDELFK